MGLDTYVKQAIPNDYVVCGLPLKPFSLGHYLLMRRYGCAFADEAEGKATEGDFLLGLCICSRTYHDFLEFIKRPHCPLFKRVLWYLNYLNIFRPMPPKPRLSAQQWISAWGQKVKRASRIYRIVRRWDILRKGYSVKEPPINLINEFKKFRQYTKEGVEVPHYWIEQDNDREPGSHWSVNILNTLSTNVCTETEALNMPMGLAFAKHFQWLQSQGAIKLYTDEEERNEREARGGRV